MPLAARIVLGLSGAALALYASASLTGHLVAPWWVERREVLPEFVQADPRLPPYFNGPIVEEPRPGREAISIGVVGLAALGCAALAGHRKPGAPLAS